MLKLFKFTLKKLKHSNFFLLQLEEPHEQKSLEKESWWVNCGEQNAEYLKMIHPSKTFCLQ